MRLSYFTLSLALTVLQTACTSGQEREPVASNYQMGERVPVGRLIYTVFERQWLPQIGEGVDARVPQNRFYLVRITAVNSGGAPVIMPTISLVDDSGASYPEIENGDGIADFIGALRSVAPAETLRGNFVFDVQPKHYKLKLTDDEGKQISLVEIPLSFDSDSPDVTTPLADHSNDLTKK
jgi:hypothetical protein